MRRRQTVPNEWLIIQGEHAGDGMRAARRLPRGTGVLLLGKLAAANRRRLRYFARTRGLLVVEERLGDAARVHNLRELRAALLSETPLILLSPLLPTATHPDWTPLPPMRAAALARLGGRKLIALGGMNRRNYAKLARLGFAGFAGISAFRT